MSMDLEEEDEIAELQAVHEIAEDLGEVHEIANGFEWRIANFFSLSEDINERYTSPKFFYCGAPWYFEIYPNGNSADGTDGYIDLCLTKIFSDFSISVEFTLALKTVYGKKYLKRNSRKIFRNGWDSHVCFRFISTSEIIAKKSELVPSGVLTIVCILKTRKFSESASDITIGECSYCDKTFNAEVIIPHEKKCLYRPIKCPECSAVVLLENWYEHECQMSSAEASMSHDFETILLSGDHSDTTVKVKEQEFLLHKSILAARNPYFDAMFKNKMKENSTGVIIIDDCDPDIFRSFIHFLYTGKVDKLSLENVCELYQATDKYQQENLKKECLRFMLNKVPVDKFCDYFVLAFTYDEKELMQKCIESFITKGKEIVRSVKWQIFLKEYPTQTNELLIKTFDKLIK